MSDSDVIDASVEARLIRLIEDFAAGIPRRLEEITAHWSEFCDTGSGSLRKDTSIALHRLAGSGAMFNLPQVGSAARAAELAIDALADTCPTPATRGKIESLLDTLGAAAMQQVPHELVETGTANAAKKSKQPGN